MCPFECVTRVPSRTINCLHSRTNYELSFFQRPRSRRHCRENRFLPARHPRCLYCESVAMELESKNSRFSASCRPMFLKCALKATQEEDDGEGIGLESAGEIALSFGWLEGWKVIAQVEHWDASSHDDCPATLRASLLDRVWTSASQRFGRIMDGVRQQIADFLW